MTLPVFGNPIALNQIQTEFGGANPINISEYYSGGAYVTAGTVGYPTGAGAVAIPSSGTISLANFYGASAAININLIDLEDIEVGVAAASVTFNTDGTLTLLGDGSTGPTNWYTPTTLGIGSSYWIKFVLGGGSDPWNAGLTNNTLYQISVSREVQWNAFTPTPPSESRSAIVDYYIYSDAGGTLLYAYGQIQVYVESTG